MLFAAGRTRCCEALPELTDELVAIRSVQDAPNLRKSCAIWAKEGTEEKEKRRKICRRS